jgi:hypothetical protein
MRLVKLAFLPRLSVAMAGLGLSSNSIKVFESATALPTLFANSITKPFNTAVEWNGNAVTSLEALADPVETREVILSSISNTVYVSRPLSEFSSCWQDNFRQPKPTQPPDYEKFANCISPSISTIVEDEKLARCCDRMHRIYTGSADAYFNGQKDCLTFIDQKPPVSLAKPLYETWLDSTFEYNGGFTTLCDGIPRATKTVTWKTIEVTTSTQLMSTPEVTTIVHYGGKDPEQILEKFPHSPPSCTLAPKTCFDLITNTTAMLEKAMGGVAGFGSVVPLANGSIPTEVEPDLEGFKEILAPVCDNTGNTECKRVSSCPGLGGSESHVDIILWPRDDFSICPNGTKATQTYSSVTWSGNVLTWPTTYVRFRTPLYDYSMARMTTPMAGITPGPLPTYTSAVVPAGTVSLLNPMFQFPVKYDYAELGTSIDSVNPEISIPMMVWESYSLLRSVSIADRLRIYEPDATTTKEIVVPKTIYHDVEPMVQVNLRDKDFKSLDPCWEFCGGWLLAVDPPILLTELSRTGLRSLEPKTRSPPREPSEVPMLGSSEAMPTGISSGEGEPGESRESRGSEAQPTRGFQAPASRIPVAAALPIQTLYPTAPPNSAGQGNDPSRGQGSGSNRGQNLPQVAITPANGRPMVIATAIDSERRTFVASGRTFSVGGPPATFDGIVLSANPDGGIEVRGGKVTSSKINYDTSTTSADRNPGNGKGGSKPKKNGARSLIPTGMLFICFIAVALEV